MPRNRRKELAARIATRSSLPPGAGAENLLPHSNLPDTIRKTRNQKRISKGKLPRYEDGSKVPMSQLNPRDRRRLKAARA